MIGRARAQDSLTTSPIDVGPDRDWQGFYDDYAEIFQVLAGELAKRDAYVLIDSRTGVTDLGSICTMVLPDKLVLVLTPNEQSLRGVLDAGWQAVKGREQLTQGREPSASVRALPIFPLASRIEEGETPLQRTSSPDLQARAVAETFRPDPSNALAPAATRSLLHSVPVAECQRAGVSRQHPETLAERISRVVTNVSRSTAEGRPL